MAVRCWIPMSTVRVPAPDPPETAGPARTARSVGVRAEVLEGVRLSSAAEHPYGSEVYGSHYQGQRGPTASRSWAGFTRADV